MEQSFGNKQKIQRIQSANKSIPKKPQILLSEKITTNQFLTPQEQIKQRIYAHGFVVETMPSIKRGEQSDEKAMKVRLQSSKIPGKQIGKVEQAQVLTDNKGLSDLKNFQSQKRLQSAIKDPSVKTDKKQSTLRFDGLDFDQSQIQEDQGLSDNEDIFDTQNKRKQSFKGFGIDNMSAIKKPLINKSQSQKMNRIQSAIQMKVDKQDLTLDEKKLFFQRGKLSSAKSGVTLPSMGIRTESVASLIQKQAVPLSGITRQFNITQSSARSLVSGFQPKQVVINTKLSKLQETQATFIIDKSSGKFDIDPRYFNSQMSKIASNLEVKTETQDLLGYQKRPQNKLDRYIDLLLKEVSNIDEFVYLLRMDQDDPYDLDVVSYEQVKLNGNREYYTISKHGLTHYKNNKPYDFIQLAFWLQERDNYDHIKTLKFFTKFRKFKTLQQWKSNVIRHKYKLVSNLLENKLFQLHRILGKQIKLYRDQMLQMNQLRFVDLNASVSFSMGEIPTLGVFRGVQERKRKETEQRIEEFSQICREIISQGFKLCLDKLKRRQYTVNPTDEQVDEISKSKKPTQSAYEELGFSNSMSYEARSDLRKECSRLIRFAYLIDFYSLEALTEIYRQSIGTLLRDFEKLVSMDEITIYRVVNQDRKDKTKGKKELKQEPLFYLQVEFNQIEIDETQIQNDDLVEWVPHPIGSSQIQDFNILYHVYLRQPKNEDDKDEEMDENFEDQIDYDKVYQRRVVNDLSRLWLNIQPSVDSFYLDIMRCITEGLNSIQYFERWSRHDDLKPYVNVLEEWDDIVGDNWDIPTSNYLNPQDCIDKQPFDEYSLPIKSLLDRAFDRTKEYLDQFQKYLMVYWEHQQYDYQVLLDQNLFNPIDSLQHTIEVLLFQIEDFQESIPYQADIGMLRINNQQLKDRLTEMPHLILEQIKKKYPIMLRNRIKDLKNWFVKSDMSLKQGSNSIDDFVKQQNFLKNIENELPYKKLVLKQSCVQSQILKNFKFDFNKVDDQTLIEVQQYNNHLAQTLQELMENSEKVRQKFSSRLNSKLIPELEQSVLELNIKQQNNKFLQLEGNQRAAIVKELSQYDDALKELEQNAQKYQIYEQTLNLPISRFEDVENLRQNLNMKLSMWKGLDEWDQLQEQWVQSKFTDIDTESIKKKAEHYTKIIQRCVKNLPPNNVIDMLKKNVFDFKDTMPVVVGLRNPSLREHHFVEIKALIQKDFEINEEFKLQDLIALGLGKFNKQIQDISTQATQENFLEQQFFQIEANWKLENFVVVAYKPEIIKDVFVLTEIDELFQMIDETLANLSNILGSRYLKTIRYQVQKLQSEILYAQDTIDDWLICQQRWIYLENVFNAPDIKKRLPVESQMFEKVDQFYRLKMRQVNVKRSIQQSTQKSTSVGETFKKHKETLNVIQKALENYLELKRTLFPRFYFLSNDELLEILAKSNDIHQTQKHMKKCFDNIYKLLLDNSNNPLILGMESGEGEKIQFNKTISTKTELVQIGQIIKEIWLNYVQDQMIDTLFRKMRFSKNEYELKERKEWVLEHPAQIVMTVSIINWCVACEIYIQQQEEDDESLDIWYQINVNQLSVLSELIRNGLNPIQHRTIVALITQDVHARDVVYQLMNENVDSVNNFLWQQQLRFYWDDQTDNIVIKQVNAVLSYGYEYMGATTRLIITPLTDRCWMTIIGALNINLGASPQGPAGTGKTESTKDLAKALGIFCVVFNCSDQIEYKMMGRHFSGLAQQGAWTCLDEFNRIDIEVLSVISQQLLSIRQALLQKLDKFWFGDTEINLKKTVGVFITMNPGYAGRTELPDNLKVLFRPVSMMIPEYGLIAEIMLFAEGFVSAKHLSSKMVQLYKLSSEQLSQQKHYDFGMRAVKSVLVMAGSLKRAYPNLQEDVLLIRAMRDSNVPKFLKEDLPLFQALVQDLFPGTEITDQDNSTIEDGIKQTMDNMKLQIVQSQLIKIIQLFETFNVRFGVMLVGQTGSGKTAAWQVLQRAMTLLRNEGNKDQKYQKVNSYIMNPKSVSMGELYGEVNPFTQEWQDGLASQILRQTSQNEGMDRDWIIFDGPVDAIWIENMNTVLDDNMMLCLANGQRIKLRNEMRILFEVQDLAVASPATVSRCGMVFMTSEELGWKPYVYTWIQRAYAQDFQIMKLSQDHLLEILDLFQFVQKFMDIRHTFSEPIKTQDLQLVKSLCNLLETVINPKFGFNFTQHSDIISRFIKHAFVYCMIWSLGISVQTDDFSKIDLFIRNQFQNIIIPNQDNVYGFYLDESSISFRLWSDKLPVFQYEKDSPFFNLVVPTVDTVRFSYNIEKLISIQKLVYLTGSSGTGKSVMVSSLLKSMKDTKYVDQVNIIFSAQTSAIVTQFSIENKLEKVKKTLYSAKPGRQIVFFIDDINMPSVEEYGAQPPIEFLRFFIDKQGVYDRKERFWKQIQNTTILACSAPPGGGRNDLTPRFTSQFNIFCLPQPNFKSLFKIFDSILSGFLLVNGFQEEVRRFAENAINSTIEVYQRILKEKLPIPSKFHYTFNLRDVSKVFQGMMMCRSMVIRDGDSFSKLWVHEVQRVFHDRLINQEDKMWFYDLIQELLQRNFKSRLDKEEIFIKNPILFGDLLRLEAPIKDYEQIIDKKKLLKVLDEKMEDFNSDSQQRLNLVFFDDAIHHILRIVRILRQPRGNMILIGVGGSGKQSLTRLSSYIMEYSNQSIEITKGYNLDNFRDFIREILKKTGVNGQQCTFLFTDNQIVFESFIEDINNLLNSGEVPNIWEPEDKKNIIEEVRQYNQQLGRDSEPDIIYNTFVERVRSNLHIMMCMSPVGDQLRIRCRQFPSLVDCSTLNWFSAWPEDALLSVSQQILSQEDFEPQILQGLTQMCKDVHITSDLQSVKFEQQMKRKVFNTPKSYLDLISLFQQTLKNKKEELKSNMQRLSSGLSKLESANKQVSELKIVLQDLQPKLEVQSKLVEEALVKVQADSLVAKEKEALVQVETEAVDKQASQISQIAEDAQYELSKVEPELIQAMQAVEQLDKKSLIDMRSYLNPPKIVETVMEGVAILMGVKYSWQAAKSLMQDLNLFIQNLLNFDKDNIPENRLQQLKKHLQNPDFNPEIIATKAPAAADLCVWCRAMNTYSDVAKKVAPKKKKVQELNVQLELANASLQQKQQELQLVKDGVAQLQKAMEYNVQNKIDLENQTNLTMARLQRAEKLTTLLADEGKRWILTVKQLEIDEFNLIGEVFLSVGYLSYCGPFTGEYRQELFEKWIELIKIQNIKISDNFSFLKTMGDPIELREWQQNGLPSDVTSQENSLFATRGYRFPLVIDPQQQANKWIKNSIENLKVLKFSDPKFQSDMKYALQNGCPVLIQDVEELLDPMIDQILAKAQYVANDGRTLIRFADADIDFDPSFQLFLSSKLSNPNFLPEIFIKVNVINFTVTFYGLEDQLLADVIKNEKPEIEEQRDENIVKLAQYKKSIIESEIKILFLLNASNSETLLDDIELIQTLEQSKIASIEVKEKIQESTILEIQIEQIRNQYRDVSIRGSILFFVIKDLSLIDPMYQYSLQYVKRLFNFALENTPLNDDFTSRLQGLIEQIMRVIYTNVCRGLFEAHKLIFTFLIAAHINKQNKKIDDLLWNTFLRGCGIFDRSQQPRNPDSNAISELNWDLAHYLSLNFEKYYNLSQHFSQNWFSQWEQFSLHEDPLKLTIPQFNQHQLDDFDTLILLKILRPEKIMFGISQYVQKQIGKFYLESPLIDMSSVYKDSNISTPIIFVLSSGADPTSMVINFANDQNHKLRQISLGQGQGAIAAQLIQDGCHNGEWIMLQNCHLARTWMPSLEIILDEINQTSKSIHQDFRLFLTSMPATYFPISILQNGIKLTTEPPGGIRANMKRTFNQMTEKQLSQCKKSNEFHKITIGLAFFHAIIQERRKFGPLGWNIRYEFNDSDFDTSITVLSMLLNEQDQVPWDALTFVTGHINYGGRVTDDWDRRCLLVLLQKFYTSDIMEENYLFSKNTEYYIPNLGTLQDYRDFCDNLPNRDDPSLFGMHANANINYQFQESDKMIQTILTLQPRIGQSKGGKSDDQVVSELAISILEQVPKTLLKEDGSPQQFELNEKGLVSSISTVLLQEMERFNTLLAKISKSLKNLTLAIKGLIVMSQDLDSMYYSLLNNQVPQIWQSVAYPSLKPLASWIKDLYARVEFLRQWLISGNPLCFWISGFFFPQSFLTGVFQTYARKYQIPIDLLNFNFNVFDLDHTQIQAAPADGVYIYGFFLEGANWDRKKKSLIDQELGQMYYSMPVILFMPQKSYRPDVKAYKTPVYKTSIRAGTLSTTGQSTNYILAVDLPSLECDPDNWTLRGAALLSQLND